MKQKDDLYIMLYRERQSMIDERNRMIEKIELYPEGTLSIQGKYYYLKTNKNGKTISKYIGCNFLDEEIERLKHQLQSRKTLKRRLIKLNKDISNIEKLLRKYGD